MSYELLTEVSPYVAASADRASRSPVYAAKKHTSPPKLEGAGTLYELFERSVRMHADKPCLGYRPTDSSGKAGDFTFLTYKEVSDKVKGVATSLKKAGVKKHERVAVFGANSVEWMIAMQATNRLALHCVPLYDTLGENAIEYIIDHSESVFLFVQASKVAAFVGALPKIQQSLKGVVVWGSGAKSDDLEEIKKKCSLVKSFDEFLSDGASSAEAPADPPSPQDFCTVMYTSGTTGDPKGVLLTHDGLAATVASLITYLDDCDKTIGPGDSVLSYLPLAHIFDRTCEEMFLAAGGKIGYWQGKLPQLVDDIGALRPTMFIGVPRVFDRIYGGIMDKISAGGCIKGMLFNWGYKSKLERLRAGFTAETAAPFWDKLVFSKVKARLGGQVRVIVSGGAPLAPHVEDFLKVTMCAPVVQGYGLTETCAASFIAVPDRADQAGTVGPPQPVTHFCLESVPEMKYDASAKPPRGELLLRGPNNFKAYYKSQDKTDEVLEKDNWFHTGDIAEITPSGAVKIIDRKKNIFKLAQGEYVAVEKVESEYKKCPEVNQIWVYGNSFESQLVAIVVPKEDKLKEWAKGQGMGDKSYEELCKDEKAKSHILAEMTTQAKASKLKGFEIVKAVHLDHEEFSVEKDLLTPTFKLRRPQLKDYYESKIDEMYSGLKQQRS